MKSRTIIGVVAVAATSLVLTSPFAAAAAMSEPRAKLGGPNTFDGTCTLSGALTFDRPLSNIPHTTTFTDLAAGTCSGTLNGTAIHELPVTNEVTGSGTLSCGAGQAHTADTLTFGRRTRLHIFTDSAGTLTQFVGHVRGAVSGDAVVHVSFLRYTDESTLAQCQAGTFRTAHYDLEARTITPLVG